MSSNNSQVPSVPYCGPCGCPPPPALTKGPPPPGAYADAEELIRKIAPPILLTIGTVGNLLTILIILRQRRRFTSTSVFLITLALSDLVIIYTGLLQAWIKTRWSVDVRSRSEIGCKFSMFLVYASIQYSSWILVAVTMERVASVIWPIKVSYGCRPRHAVIVVLVTLLVILGLNSHFLYGYGRSQLPRYNGETVCKPLYQDYFEFMRDIWYWIDFIVPFALPFVILTTGNIILIFKLSKSRSDVRRMSILESQGTKTFNKETKSTSVILIVLCVMFLIFMSPASIFFIYLPYRMDEIERAMCDDPVDSFRRFEETNFWETVTTMLTYVNASFNFVMYVLSGSKFRSELRSLFCCDKQSPQSVFGVTSSTSGSSRRRNATRTDTDTSPETQPKSNDQMNADENPEVSPYTISSKL